ncbi:Hypothetical predicted protein [Olea europaea subsp. europaea]|uniref:Uncharacterized protein n=1 Tax=Olea europaea subsp. europaea TaxID=158383 RepID=A0A8S0SID1_OLEEU|nr:Hypothetical predicted protein [Olea europaea subsp. europaea]
MAEVSDDREVDSVCNSGKIVVDYNVSVSSKTDKAAANGSGGGLWFEFSGFGRLTLGKPTMVNMWCCVTYVGGQSTTEAGDKLSLLERMTMVATLESGYGGGGGYRRRVDLGLEE